MDSHASQPFLWRVNWELGEYRRFSRRVLKARNESPEAGFPVTTQRTHDGEPCLNQWLVREQDLSSVGSDAGRQAVAHFREQCQDAKNRVDKDAPSCAWSVFQVDKNYSSTVPMPGRDLLTDAETDHVLGRFFFSLATDARSLEMAMTHIEEDQGVMLCRHEELMEATSEAAPEAADIDMNLENLESGISTIHIEEKPGVDTELYLARDRLLYVPKGLGFVLRARPGITAYYLSWCLLAKDTPESSLRSLQPACPTRKPDTYTMEDLERDIEQFTETEMKRMTKDNRGKRRLMPIPGGRLVRKSTKEYAYGISGLKVRFAN